MYSYVLQDPINFIDPLGLSAQDVIKIRNAYNNAVNRMNDKGWRRPGSGLGNGLLNNMNQSLNLLSFGKFGNLYFGCGDQSQEVLDELSNLDLDDSWDFVMHHRPGHFNVRGTSSNPSDPRLTLDPWYNSFGAK